MSSDFGRINRLPPYVFAEINKLKAKLRHEGKDIIDFGMGNPDMPTPVHIREKLKEVVDKPGAGRYSMSKGIAGLRKAQCAYYQRRFGVKLNQEKEVIVTLGSKEGLANLFAVWEKMGEGQEDKVHMKMTPEIVLKLFRRITDDDVDFMGFNPKWSRPDWMVCQVLPVPPPAVRPSVKHDAQQRSEDDISHIIVSIIKTNKTLEEKIKQNAAPNVIDDWTTVLQYYVATQIDNKIPGVASVAQRSGRPLKSIKERLNGKGGRVRGNLMGKRVDFSARSVITPDPNLSIRELGVPMKVAKNITKPVLVNGKNMKFLLKLVRNGPDVHPGAKILERKNGESISLRYVDRASVTLEEGDIVHRHMMDGDGVLFNRQPTLHRMSMMCHIAKIMPVGDTFRMNVADTKPYNADRI